ncbi:MAG: polysaccharide biosynthesis C-terminal domain-containing protein, partial [Erysipelotrichaceae bacterium]|nr:polysaccharide biosynthesis C-terminal domain-containing protein [Erysipelotrichaceae bacterium]
ACIAIVMAEASVTLSQIIFIRGKLKLEVKARTVLLYFADAVIMGAVVLFIGRMMGPRLLTNLVQVASGAVIYLGILTLFKEEFHMDILKKAQGLISRH